MKKLLVLFVVLLSLLIACNNEKVNNKNQEVNNENQEVVQNNQVMDEVESSQAEVGSSTFVIEIEHLNSNETDGKFYVYLVEPNAELGSEKAFKGMKYGPLEVDENNQVIVDLESNYNLAGLIKRSDAYAVQVVVASEEDIYLRNPLNEKQIIEFEENTDEDTMYLYELYSKEDHVKVAFKSGYPEGILSLSHRDAIFVMKVVPSPDAEVDKSYVAGIEYEDGLTYWIARIARAYNYYDAPFFEGDLINKAGSVVVKDYDTDERLEYEGQPMNLEFDENGKCKSGDIIEIILK